MTTESPVRRFAVPDYTLMDAARTVASQLPHYLRKFKELDQDVFNEIFLEDFHAKISTTEDIPSDEIFLQEQISGTVHVREQLDESVNLIQSTKYHISKVSKNGISLLDQFGYNDLRKIRKSAPKMITFLEDFLRNLLKHSDVLTAAGLSPTRGEEIDRHIAELKQKRSEQQDAITRRSDMAKHRIHMLNQIWDIMVTINDAAEYALPDDPVGRDIFRLPRSKKRSKKDVETE